VSNEQINHLLQLLEKIANHQYTITGAADWPILAAIGAILLALIAMMWSDLRSTIKDNRGEWQVSLTKHEVDVDRKLDLLWDAMRHCQGDCCPPRSSIRHGGD